MALVGLGFDHFKFFRFSIFDEFAVRYWLRLKSSKKFPYSYTRCISLDSFEQWRLKEMLILNIIRVRL